MQTVSAYKVCEYEDERPATSDQRPAPRPESEQPVRNFTPSEKIQADSTVAFPVDI